MFRSILLGEATTEEIAIYFLILNIAIVGAKLSMRFLKESLKIDDKSDNKERICPFYNGESEDDDVIIVDYPDDYEPEDSLKGY